MSFNFFAITKTLPSTVLISYLTEMFSIQFNVRIVYRTRTGCYKHDSSPTPNNVNTGDARIRKTVYLTRTSQDLAACLQYPMKSLAVRISIVLALRQRLNTRHRL